MNNTQKALSNLYVVNMVRLGQFRTQNKKKKESNNLLQNPRNENLTVER